MFMNGKRLVELITNYGLEDYSLAEVNDAEGFVDFVYGMCIGKDTIRLKQETLSEKGDIISRIEFLNEEPVYEKKVRFTRDGDILYYEGRSYEWDTAEYAEIGCESYYDYED